MAIIVEHALSVIDVLLENIAVVLKVISSAEVTVKVMGCRWLTLVTLVTEFHDRLLHDFYQCREILRLNSLLSFGYWSCSRGGHLQVIEHKREQHGPMEYKSRSLMDLLEGIWVIREVVREFELKSMGDFTPEFRWEATNEGTALLGSGDPVFHN